MWFQPYSKNYRPLRNAERGKKWSSPRKNTPIAYSVPNGQSSKHTSNSIIETEKVVFRRIYVYSYAHMCITTINKQREHKFERQKGRVYGNIRSKDREEEIDVTISSSQNM